MKVKASLALISAAFFASSFAVAAPKLYQDSHTLEDGTKVKAYKVECNSKTSLKIAQTNGKKWCYQGESKNLCNRNKAKVATKACKIAKKAK